MPTVLEIFRNQELGISAWVTKTQQGYAVTLRDDDAGENLPIVRIHPELENAIKYGLGRTVTLELSQTSLETELVVSDLGEGVPEAERERIFEAFYRPQGMPESGHGAGLGLALVRSIARAHGGDVACLPREGGGSLFEVWFDAGAGGAASTSR